MKLNKISENIYEIPKSGKMNVPVRVFASEKLLDDIKKDISLEQMKNVATLPGVLQNTIVLSDAHQGYGFCIGGVAAFDIEKGIISPGGVGYDISCSVRVLRTNLTRENIKGKSKELSVALSRAIPSGIGKGGRVKLDEEEMRRVLREGAKFAVDGGYGVKEDYEHAEEDGCMEDADPACVSKKAISRGKNQLGSLGSGNHFLDIQYVDEIFDEKTAKVFGLKKNQICIMIHCGSRGLGHQVASDYIKLMEEKYGTQDLPDRQLVNAPINSELGKRYYKAMCAAVNFAFYNKQIITHFVRKVFREFFPESKIEVLYDICHNIAKFEEHEINGKKKTVCVHRKGATRSFGPGRKEIVKSYRKVGCPIFIPGSMATSSYVLVGTKKAEELTFGSTAHGAGRLMSRHEAHRRFNLKEVERNLQEKKIELNARSRRGIVEEASGVYKDVDEVVRVSDEVGIGKLVARLKPLVVVMG